MLNFKPETIEKWGRLLTLAILLIFAVVGWLLIDDYLEPLHNLATRETFAPEYFKRICEALAIASLIGLTVDISLKKELSREVFLASIGYVLPEELRPEMRWLCRLDTLCTEDRIDFSFTEIPEKKLLQVDIKAKAIGPEY